MDEERDIESELLNLYGHRICEITKYVDVLTKSSHLNIIIMVLVILSLITKYVFNNNSISTLLMIIAIIILIITAILVNYASMKNDEDFLEFSIKLKELEMESGIEDRME